MIIGEFMNNNVRVFLQENAQLLDTEETLGKFINKALCQLSYEEYKELLKCLLISDVSLYPYYKTKEDIGKILINESKFKDQE